jgi:hypothetical protein
MHYLIKEIANGIAFAKCTRDLKCPPNGSVGAIWREGNEWRYIPLGKTLPRELDSDASSELTSALDTTASNIAKHVAGQVVNENKLHATLGITKPTKFYYDFQPLGISSSNAKIDDIDLSSIESHWESKAKETKGDNELVDRDFEFWLQENVGKFSALLSCTEFPPPQGDWQWCGHPQDHFCLTSVPPFAYKFGPITNNANVGTCDLTDAKPATGTGHPRRPAENATGSNFIEAKTTGKNSVTITHCSYQLIQKSIHTEGCNSWIMIATDWEVTAKCFQPKDIIVIGPETLKQFIPLPPPPASDFQANENLRIEKSGYEFKFAQTEGTPTHKMDFSIIKTGNWTLHFHRPGAPSMPESVYDPSNIPPQVPPPPPYWYKYPEPVNEGESQLTTNLYIYC